MKTLLWITLIFMGISLKITPAQAGEGDTNMSPRDLEKLSKTVTIPSPELNLWEQYNRELEKGSTIVTDRFGQPSYLKWTRLSQRPSRAKEDTIEALGIDTVQDLALNSLRETFVDNIDLDNIGDFWEDFAKDLFIGSVGNTAEEEGELVSSTYSVTETEARKKSVRGNSIRYGIRMGSKPYTYVNPIIRNNAGTPVVFARFRLNYSPLGSDAIKGSFSVGVPIGGKWILNGGISRDLIKLNDRDSQVASIRLERVSFKKGGLMRALYFGTRFDSRGTTADFGLSGRF